MKQFLQRVMTFMPLIFGFGLILATVLLLMPSYTVPKAFDFYDKAQHGLMFTALALAGQMAYPKHVKAVCLGLIFYGGLMEVLQTTLTTTRHGDWFDWAADSAGVAIGLVGYILVLKVSKIAINNIAE